MSDAISSEGVDLAYDAGSNSFTSIGEVTDISGPGGQATVIPVSHLKSTFAEKLMGLADEGQITCSVNLIPGDAGQKAMRQARKNKTKTPFKITLTDDDATELTFNAFVLGFSISTSVDTQITGDITLEVTGEVTWSSDAAA